MSETPEMVERVAKAIDAARMAWMNERHPDGKYWDEDFVDVPDDVLAHAAIEAMRDPPPLELYPGVHAYADVERSCRPVAFRAGWNAVISAALATPAPERMR